MQKTLLDGQTFETYQNHLFLLECILFSLFMLQTYLLTSFLSDYNQLMKKSSKIPESLTFFNNFNPKLLILGQYDDLQQSLCSIAILQKLQEIIGE